MADLFPSVIAVLIAGIIAFAIQFCELYFTKYPNTIGLFIGKTQKIYWFSLMYGVAGALLMLLVLYFFDATVLMGDNPINNIYIQAFIVGLTVKGLLEINFISIKVGTQEAPAGLKTLTQLFEPYFTSQIALEEYNYTKEYVDQRISKYTDLIEIKSKIQDNAHVGIKGQEFDTFLIDLNKIGTTPSEALRFYLERFGRNNFDRVFPL